MFKEWETKHTKVHEPHAMRKQDGKFDVLVQAGEKCIIVTTIFLFLSAKRPGFTPKPQKQKACDEDCFFASPSDRNWTKEC